MFYFFYLVLCSDRIAIRQRGEAKEEKIGPMADGQHYACHFVHHCVH